VENGFYNPQHRKYQGNLYPFNTTKIDVDCYVEGSDPCALIQEENYKNVMTLSGMDNDKFGSEVVTSH